jgi:mono/diheme cytochrome c family protein
MRRSAAYGKANHLGSIVFNKLPPKQMMKVASTKFAKLIQLCVMAILAFTPFSVVDTVVAYPESIPHFPGDRWDPEWTERDVWGPDIMEPGQLQRMTRHWTFMNEGVPPEYRGKANPLASTRSVIQAGSMLYQQQCSACHGAEGMGDGKAANSVNPSPALLAYMIQRPQSVDEYLMWSIAEGGKAFGTPMPAFKSTLSDLQIWKIIIFMRAGFPPLEGK